MMMMEVAAFFILLSDAVLCCVSWAGLVLLQCSSCGALAGVLAMAAVKWVVLHKFTSILTDGRPQAELRQLVALLCLLLPVREGGRMLMLPPSEPYSGPSPDLRVPLLATMSSSLAFVVWEKGLCGGGKTTDGNRNQDARRLLLRLSKYFRPDALPLVAAFSFLILGVICDTFIPSYQGEVVNMLRDRRPLTTLSSMIGKLALVSLGSAVFSSSRGGLFKCSLARLNKRLKHLLFGTFLQQEVRFFEANDPGCLSARLHSDVDKMGLTVALNTNVLVRSSVKLCLMLAVMFQQSYKLTMVTCIEMPLFAVLQHKYITLSKELKGQIQDCHAQNNKLAFQTLSGIHTVRSFKAEKDELRRYSEALEEMGSIKRRLGTYRAVFHLTQKLLSLGIKILMLLQARRLIVSGQLSVGTLITFLLYQKPMSSSVQDILYSCGETVSTVGIVSKFFSYLDRTPKCKKAGELAPEDLEGRIVFQNVTFTHPSSKDKPALKCVSLELKPGKMTALVGPSGSGKTSCVNLLKRLYEPDEGEILLDGEPLHRYNHKYLHRKVAVVSQNPVLFSGSLRYNIEYGLSDCTLEKVKAAARKTDAEDFFSGASYQYDTEIRECGSGLAGGMRQSIAIVRALVRDPKVLILDEATSELDVEAQHTVLQEVLSCGRTVLVVAHQLKTAEKADHIIFLENGVVVEEGTHQELMAKRGRYHRLKEEQFS
ncbi:antigen peptide transporter 2 [Aulostomus maculatus]